MASFNSAFAAARKAGKKAFTWQGKRFNTKLSNGTPSKAPVPAKRSASNGTPATVKAPGSRPSSEKTASIKGGIAKAAVKSGASRSTQGKAIGMSANPKLTIGSRIANSVRIGKTAVDRGHRRDAAKAANKGAGAAVSDMLKGMDKKRKK